MKTHYQFLKQKSNYRDILAYQKAECIFDITYYFAHTYLEYGDRTMDQMIQAARSGKQNIAEGSATVITSSETELELINVARTNFQELQAYYENYLREHGKEIWAINSEKAAQTRRVCTNHNDTGFYRERIAVRSGETVANIAITMIRQEDMLLRKLYDRLQKDFVNVFGIREKAAKARLEHGADRR